MPLEFLDCLEPYPLTGISLIPGCPWINTSASGNPEISNSAPAHGSNCLTATNSGGTERTGDRIFAARSDAVYAGCNFLTTIVEGVLASGARRVGFQIAADGSDSEAYVIQVFSASGKFEIYKLASGPFTKIAESQLTVLPNVYYSLKMYYEVDTVNDTAELRVQINNEIVFDGSVPPLRDGSNDPTGADRIKIGSSGTSGPVFHFDDMFCFTDVTAQEKTAIDNLPAFAVLDALPDGNGATQDFAVTGGVAAFEALANRPFNLSEYIESTAINDISDFTIASPSTGPQSVIKVIAAMNYYYAEKSDVSAGNIQASFNTGLGVDNALLESPIYYFDAYDTNPATAAAWSPADLTSLTESFERTL